jgi:hypothetical protein
MDAGMLLAALPGLFVDREIFRSLSSRVWCWIAGLLGMFVGMEIGAVALSGLPIDANSASAQFFLTFAAMVLGMCLGMLVGCEAARRLVAARR